MPRPAPRRETETQLRLLSRAVEQSPSSVVITNLAGEIEYVNPKFSQVTGFSYEEAIGQNPRILKSGGNPPELYRELWATILSGKEWRGEIINRRKNGEIYWEFASISGVMDAGGTITHFVAVKEDITGRKQIENSLRESEERFRNIFENSPVAYLALNEHGCLTNVNANLCEMLGYEREALIGRPFSDFWQPAARPGFEPFLNTFKAYRTIQTDLVLCPKDSHEIIVSLEGSLQTDSQAGFLRAHCTLFNITERQQLQSRLQRQNASLSALHQSALEFLHQRNLGVLYQSLISHAVQLLDADTGEMCTLDGDALVVQAAAGDLHLKSGQRYHRGQAALTWQAVDTREPALANAGTTWPQASPGLDRPALSAAISLPILNGPTCLGVLCMRRTRTLQPFTSDQVQIGRLFAQIAALAIENVQLQNTLIDQSVRDPLTGLYNRRYLFETLSREFTRAVRDRYPISVVLLDIDQFKQINDNYGHGAGDTALRALAALLQDMIRASDILCRYGGDEHIIVMPNASPDTALFRAEQIRQDIAQLRPTYQGQPLRVTISLGIAAFPDHGSSIDEVIARADRALYRSKNNGRNQSTLFS